MVVAAVRRDDHHDRPNESYYCFCENLVDTMTITRRRITTDFAEGVRNDSTVHDGVSVDNDDSKGHECCDCHCSSDGSSWTIMMTSSRTVHPAYIDSIYPSNTSQSSESVIARHSTSHLGHTWHPFPITSGFYS